MTTLNVLSAALVVAKKDLMLSFRDRTGVALGFGLPVILVLVFGFIYKMTFGAPGGMVRTQLYFADLDKTKASEEFVKTLRGSSMISLHPDLDESEVTREDLKKKVEDGDAHHALILEPGFGRSLEEGKLPKLTVIRDPRRELESQMVSIGIMQAMMSTGGANLAPALTTQAMIRSGLPESYAERMTSLARGFSGAIGTLFMESSAEKLTAQESGKSKQAADDAPKLDMSAAFTNLIPVDNVDIQPPAQSQTLTYMLSQSLSGIAQMMLMFGLVACGTLLLQERDSGTLRRLLLAPVSSSSLLLGKLLFMAAMGAMQLAVLFVVGAIVFKVNVMRDPVTLVVLSLVLIFAITSFGILIATLARSAKQAEGLSTLLILLMSALGGAWFPLANFDLPLAGQIATRCTLTFWAMDSLQGMFYSGKNLADPAMLRDIAVLMGFGIVACVISARAFRARFAS